MINDITNQLQSWLSNKDNGARLENLEYGEEKRETPFIQKQPIEMDSTFTINVWAIKRSCDHDRMLKELNFFIVNISGISSGTEQDFTHSLVQDPFCFRARTDEKVQADEMKESEESDECPHKQTTFEIRQNMETFIKQKFGSQCECKIVCGNTTKIFCCKKWNI